MLAVATKLRLQKVRTPFLRHWQRQQYVRHEHYLGHCQQEKLLITKHHTHKY